MPTFNAYFPGNFIDPKVPGRIVGWTLKDENGDEWLVEFGSEDMPANLFSAGDEVTFRFDVSGILTEESRGYVAISDRLQSLVAVAGDSNAPSGIAVTDGETECQFGECMGALVKSHITIFSFGLTFELAAGQTARKGGFVVTSDYNTTGSRAGGGCVDGVDGSGPTYLFMAYRPAGISVDGGTGMDGGTENDSGQ